MKTLIVYVSTHHGNTEKIAKTMAEVLKDDLKELKDVKPENVIDYTLIGFGSGIYMWKHHKSLLDFVDSLRPVEGKKAFIFSTSGATDGIKYHKKLREKLVAKGFNIVGEFNCLGWDTFGLLKLSGGANKGRPDEKDIDNARNFARGLMMTSD